MPTYEVEIERDGKTFVIEVEGQKPPSNVEVERLLDVQNQVFRTSPKEEAITEAFPTTMAPRLEKMGEVGGFIGEIAGSAIASRIPGGGAIRNLLRPAVAGIGAGVGSQAERLARGGELDLKQGFMEGLMSAGPEAAEELFRATGRGLIRLTRGGKQLQSDVAADVAEGMAHAAFRPPSSQQARQLFDVFDTTPAATTRIKSALDTLDEGGIKQRVLRELKSLDRGALESIEAGGELSLKRLQEYRSLIGEQAESVAGRTGGARLKRELKSIQRTIDRAIDETLETVQLGGAAQSARDAWHRLKATERMHDLITSPPVTRFTDPKSDELTFNILSLRNQLRADRGRARRIVQDLSRIPGAQADFDAYLRQLQALVPSGQINFTDTSGWNRQFAIAGVNRMFSSIITSAPGRALFQQAVAFGRGRVSFNTVAIIFNMMRRQESDVQKQQTQQSAIHGFLSPFQPPAGVK